MDTHTDFPVSVSVSRFFPCDIFILSESFSIWLFLFLSVYFALCFLRIAFDIYPCRLQEEEEEGGKWLAIHPDFHVSVSCFFPCYIFILSKSFEI